MQGQEVSLRTSGVSVELWVQAFPSELRNREGWQEDLGVKLTFAVPQTGSPTAPYTRNEGYRSALGRGFLKMIFLLSTRKNIFIFKYAETLQQVSQIHSGDATNNT